MIKLENRRYIGSKTKLIDWIFEIINKETSNIKSFCDIFAGTGIVSKYASYNYDKIILNDFLISNYISYQAFFSNLEYDKKKIENIIDYYNSINPTDLKDNYFSINFGDKYFTNDVAKKIGYLREDIEKRKQKELNFKESCILITSLMYAFDKIANTVGHFDAYIKKEIRKSPLTMELLENISGNFKIYNENANELVKKIKADIFYIDPPYNSRQYSRFYHIWENIAEWKKPELFGAALKPKGQKMSDYCKTSAKNTFNDLIMNIGAKYIVVSYNNTYTSKSNSSKNKMQFSDIKETLLKRGNVKVFEKPYKFFNTGKTDFANHMEYLFVVEVKQ